MSVNASQSLKSGNIFINVRLTNGMTDSLERLYAAIVHINGSVDMHVNSETPSRTAKLLQMGMMKVARKVGEEAIEVALDAVQGERANVIAESADLLYNLTVLWVAMGISMEDVWAEMNRRESLYGIAEKNPKAITTG
jgi:phosphoribosyl-ATP pyrophosphohydrolase